MLSFPTLQYFKVAAETQNFTKAAEMLNISQPALSRVIQKLQADIGCPLFTYKGRGVELNTYGKIFLEYVTDALNALQEGERKIHSLIAPESGTVRITSLYSLGVNFLPYVIKDFKAEYPNVTLSIAQHPTKIQLDLLRDDKVDICFCTDYSGAYEDSDFEKIIVLIEDLYVLVNKQHRLASRTEVALRELDQEDYVAFSDLTFFQKNLNPLFQKVGAKPNIVCESNEDSTVAGFVSAGIGVAIIPPILGVDFNKCVPLKISYPICQRTLCMVWKKNIAYTSPVVKNFRDFVIKWLPNDRKFTSPYYK